MVIWTLKAAIRLNDACKYLIAKHVNFFQYKTMIFLDSGSVTFSIDWKLQGLIPGMFCSSSFI